MVGKNNKKLLMEMGANKFKRYTLKKLSIGVASVSIGIGLMFGATEQVSAQAEAGTVIEHDEPVNQDITPQSEQQEPEIDHVLEAKRQEVNAYLVSSNLQRNRDQFKAQIDQATSVSELVNIENQINEAIAEQVEETEKNNQQSEEQEQKPQDTQVSDEKQSEELEKKRKAVKDELGKSEIVIWDDYLALLNKINEATSIEELDAISAKIRGDKASEKQDEKEQEADSTIEQTTPATPQQPQVDVQQNTSKPEVEYTLDQVRHFFSQEEIAKIEAGQITIKQALQKALGTQPDIKTNQNHHEENVLAAGVENLDNKQEEQTGKRRTRRNTGNVDLNRKFGLNDNFMSVIEYINALENSGYLNVEESLMFKRAALRRFGNAGRPSNELANDRPNDNGQKWNDFLKSSNKNVFKDKKTRDLLEESFSSYTNNGRNRERIKDYNRTIEIATKVQDYIKNRNGSNQQLIIDGKEDARHQLDKFSPDNINNVELSNGKYNVTLEMEKNYSKSGTQRQYAYDIYMIQLKKSTDDKLSSQPKITDTTGKSGTLTRKEINGGEYVQYIYKRNYDYNISDTPKGLLGKKVQFNLEFKDPLDPIKDQISSYYLGDTYSTQAWNGDPNQSFIHYKNESKVLRQLSNKMSELQVQQLFNSIDEKIKEFTNTYIKLPDSSGTKIVNNKNYNELKNLKNEIDSLYKKAKESIERITQGTTKQSLLQRLQGGHVNGRFQEGYKQDIDRLADFNINDRNDNGTLDSKEVADAKEKVEAAKEAQRQAEAKKQAIEEDGVVNPSEVSELEALNKEVTDAKNEADTAVNALPDGAANGTDTKASLQGELGGINPVDVPAVTDANSNGIADDAEWENGQGLINEKPEFPAEELERLLQVERDKAADYIAGLQNLDASKVKEFQVAIQKAQTVPAIEEIVQAAEKLNAKSAQSTPDSGNGAGTTQPEKPEFEGGVNGQGLINEKPTFPAEELERLLQVERDKAANYIASLPNLDISKVNEFKAAIQKAQTVPVIEEIIQAAEKLNTELGRGKVGGEQEQPAEPEAPTQPGQAESERPADKPAVTDHLQNAKTQAEATINSLSHLTQSQKDQFIASVHAATTVGQIHQIVEEARYMNDQQAIQESIKQAKSGERLPETATGSWLLGLSGISSLLVGLGLKKKREDDDK